MTKIADAKQCDICDTYYPKPGKEPVAGIIKSDRRLDLCPGCQNGLESLMKGERQIKASDGGRAKRRTKQTEPKPGPEISSPESKAVTKKPLRLAAIDQKIRSRIIKLAKAKSLNEITKTISGEFGQPISQTSVFRIVKQANVKTSGKPGRPTEKSKKKEGNTGKPIRPRGRNAKRELNNAYMEKVSQEAAEETTAPSICVLCGAEHNTDDDLCPECHANVGDYQASG